MKGDRDAMAFLKSIAYVARLADDVADKDHGDAQRNVCLLLHYTMVDLPRNPFFIRHHDSLAPLVVEALTQWKLSDEFRASDDWRKQTFGFVWREASDRFLGAAAYLVGGLEHATAVVREFWSMTHGQSTETVAAWVMGD